MSTATPEPILLTGIASLDTVAGIRERAIVLASDADDGELVFDLSGLEVDGSAVVSRPTHTCNTLKGWSGDQPRAVGRDEPRA